MDPNYMPFHPNPSKPAFQVPAGAVDAHCHVFGPGQVFPYHPSRKYTPCDAPKAKLFALRDFLGFSRNVIVQASCHGPDNRALVDALVNSDGKAKGIAVVDPDVTDKELSELNAAGVKGVRFNFLPRLADELPHETYRDIVARIRKLDWQLVVYFEAHDLKRLQPLFQSFDVPIVVDHLAVPDVSKPLDANPDFDAFVDLVSKDDRFVVKVTCPERISKIGPPYDDSTPYARRVVEAIPNRVLWGTDWPHPNMRTHMPDDGKLVDMIPKIAVTAEQQRKLLVDNPMRLYWVELSTQPGRRGISAPDIEVWTEEAAMAQDERKWHPPKEAHDYDDIPGTVVFDAQRSRIGYNLNQFLYSLMKAENRKAFLADESTYLDKFNLMPEQKTAVMKRDWNTLLDLGGVSYALAKLAFTDQHSYQFMAAEMTGMSQEGYLNMMLAGGRSVEGWRSKKERGEA